MPFLKNKKQLLQHKAWRRPRVEGRIAPQEASNLGSEASAGGRGCLQTQTLVPQKGRLAVPSHTHSRVLRWRVASELPSRCGGQGLALQTPDTQALRLPVPIRGRDPPTLSLQDWAPGPPSGRPRLVGVHVHPGPVPAQQLGGRWLLPWTPPAPGAQPAQLRAQRS